MKKLAVALLLVLFSLAAFAPAPAAAQNFGSQQMKQAQKQQKKAQKRQHKAQKKAQKKWKNNTRAKR